jgi:DNA-binding protein H-NS
VNAKVMTQGERLTRIETLLEQAVVNRAEDRAAMREDIRQMAEDIKQIKKDVSDDKQDLQALKNKGLGVIVGAAIAGGGIASGIGHIIGWFTK